MRTNCAVRMRIILLKTEKYECQDFVEEHNHELHVASTTHMMRSQRIISDVHASEIELADNSGIRPKPFFEFMGNQAGGRQILGYTQVDHYNYLRTKHQRDLKYDESGSLLRGVVIFGATLLYDETAESFKWLFETFLESHGKKKHITIFTDQDAAMENAISKVFLETCHGLCTWHLMQNGIKHLGNLMKVENGSWLDRIYGLNHKWTRCYMKNTFTGVNDKRANELKAEFVQEISCQRTLGMCYIKEKDESNTVQKYVVGVLNSAGVGYKVECNPSEFIFECSCKKFESFGILCCHIMKIMERLDIKVILEAYILNRWTRGARKMIVAHINGKEVEEDVNLDFT
ncbi:protein FAR1-RELATED SEQUENCE 5-like [Telopea speciosissima]|uniref:protein FAR1-RELATED SEQUENCE 5-like n=1 Tax=Telopea speciosissima TaxID=54955 RepID=UPI001CC7CC7D|nr:protein FAR1-RELATED SEQUENCE 5-like [Telopea speciosissima]